MYTLNSVEVHAVAYGVDLYNQSITGDKAKCITSKASDADHIPCVAYSIENHPNDSRVKLAEDDIVQALTSRMGTGGGATCRSYSSESHGERKAKMTLKHGRKTT